MALFATSGAACSAVLGLDPPTLAACADGCPDATTPVPDGSGGSSGGDSSVPIDSATQNTPDATPDAVADAIADVVAEATPDSGPPTGVRCGGGGSPTVYCNDPTPLCCLTFSDAGSPSYACATDTSACTGYSIACASDNDCPGSDVCCFYQSGIKCEPEDTASCATALVCDPSAPASDDECNTGQTCSVAYLYDGGALPYYGCN
ncbi:MAG: hypothetical protein ACLQVI_10240 [Polyangiaceae bacterium]